MEFPKDDFGVKIEPRQSQFTKGISARYICILDAIEAGRKVGKLGPIHLDRDKA